MKLKKYFFISRRLILGQNKKFKKFDEYEK